MNCPYGYYNNIYISLGFDQSASYVHEIILNIDKCAEICHENGKICTLFEYNES